MSIELLTILMVGSLAGLLALGVPYAFATGLVAAGVAYAFYGVAGLLLIPSRIYSFASEFVLVAVPMFILMASLLERSGVARDLFRAMHILAGGLRGGLAVQTMVVSVIVAAMTGIIGGEIVLLGLVALPQMLRCNYNQDLAVGTICAGGSLGSMIPPSIVLIFYGLTANVPIGDLFIAAIMPGLLLAGLYTAYILILCQVRPDYGPPAPTEERDLTVLQKVALLRSVALPVLVATAVLGSIYAGIASISEAAALGVVGVLASTWVRGELSRAMVVDALRQTLRAVGAVLWLTFGATALIGVYNLVGGITFVQNLITGLPFGPYGIVLVMMGILIVLGMFMDWVGILLLTMPIFVPVVVELGFDPVWFGVLFTMNMQISYLTPPFGPAAFYLKSVAPSSITLRDIYRAMLPFIGLQAIGLALVLFLPIIALWLPRVL